MTTIRDVAQLANVSVATVSRVLNGSPKVSQKSKEAVLQAQKELGFYLNANARALAQRDSHTLGLVVCDVSDPYFGAVVKSCEDVVHKQGYNLLIGQGYHNAEQERQAIEALLSYQCRGLIVHSFAISENELKEYMDKVPCMILINRVLKGYESRCVTCDNYMGERLVVDELASNGHKKIAYVGSTHDIQDSTDRLQGYLDSLSEHGLPINEEMIVKADPSLEGGANAALKLLERFKPGEDFTAVACYSDVIASGLISTFYQRNVKVPDMVSVTGFDNLFLSSCAIPPLTTIDNPVALMCEEAVNRSMALYSGQRNLPCKTLEVQLVKRQSIKNLS